MCSNIRPPQFNCGDLPEREENENADFYLTKCYLLRNLVDMESLYFNGLWSQMTTGVRTRTIKTLWFEN